jgi:hypothetical protein
MQLAANTKTLDECTVAVDVDVGKVSEEATTLTNEEKKATTRVVVVLVLLEVLGEVLDALGEQCNLNFRGSGVAGVGCVLVDDCFLDICRKSHGYPFRSLRGATTLVVVALCIRGR